MKASTFSLETISSVTFTFNETEALTVAIFFDLIFFFFPIPVTLTRSTFNHSLADFSLVKINGIPEAETTSISSINSIFSDSNQNLTRGKNVA